MTRVTFRKFYDVCAAGQVEGLSPEDAAILEIFKTDAQRAAELLKKARNGGPAGEEALKLLNTLIADLERKNKSFAGMESVKQAAFDLKKRMVAAAKAGQGGYKWEIEANRR